MEEKISQVLTVLLCFMDTNNNLDFLKPLNKETWQYRLWMGVFQCDKYIASHFKDVGDFSNSNVEQSGWKGQWFKPLFPFSWILFQRTEEIVNAGDEVQDGNTHYTSLSYIYIKRPHIISNIYHLENNTN